MYYYISTYVLVKCQTKSKENEINFAKRNDIPFLYLQLTNFLFCCNLSLGYMYKKFGLSILMIYNYKRKIKLV